MYAARPTKPHTPYSHAQTPTHIASARPTSSTSANADKNFQPVTTYHGHIKTTRDAIVLLAACDLPNEAGRSGFAPPRRIKRRLLDSERPAVLTSGSIFVWEEKEAGMRRWTDGKCWSASRVSGCFLTYRELEARKKPSSSITGGPTSNLYKSDGLIKQSFSMTTSSGRKLHVISYYTKSDVREGRLRWIGEDPRFVGEGGGEWGLTVDEHEFPDPITRAGDLSADVPLDELDTSASPSSSPILPGKSQHISQGWTSEADSPTTSSCPSSAEDVAKDAKDVKDVTESRHVSHGQWSADGAPFYESRHLNSLPAQLNPADQHHARFPRGTWPSHGDSLPVHNVNGKRSLGDIETPVHATNQARPVRPQLKRLRSSSMNSGSEHYLAPIRVAGRANSADDSVSAGTPGLHERDSAVGALLSLRSSIGSIGDESSPSLTSMRTAFTRSPSASTPGSMDQEPAPVSKSTFICADRAALDRFKIRI